MGEHINADKVRSILVSYVWQATHTPMIDARGEDKECVEMVQHITNVIIASNQGLVEHIVDQINNAPSRKQGQRWRGWRFRLSKMVHAYMTALYSELDLRDLYLIAPYSKIQCATVINNPDCITAACAQASVVARTRKALFGWVYFSRKVA